MSCFFSGRFFVFQIHQRKNTRRGRERRSRRARLVRRNSARRHPANNHHRSTCRRAAHEERERERRKKAIGSPRDDSLSAFRSSSAVAGGYNGDGEKTFPLKSLFFDARTTVQSNQKQNERLLETPTDRWQHRRGSETPPKRRSMAIVMPLPLVVWRCDCSSPTAEGSVSSTSDRDRRDSFAGGA